MKRKVQIYLLIYLFKKYPDLPTEIYLFINERIIFIFSMFIFLLEANIRIHFFVRAIIWRTSGEIFTGHSVI